MELSEVRPTVWSIEALGFTQAERARFTTFSRRAGEVPARRSPRQSVTDWFMDNRASPSSG